MRVINTRPSVMSVERSVTWGGEVGEGKVGEGGERKGEVGEGREGG